MPQVTRVTTGKLFARRCALGLAVVVCLPFSGAANADDATITLELTYGSGAGSAGIWELFGRVDSTPGGANGDFGLSAVRALLNDVDFGVDGSAISLSSGIGALDPINSGGANERPPAILLGDGTIDLIYGQDLSESNGNTVAFGVGVVGNSLLASGTFSAGMTPSFGQDSSGGTPLFTQALFLPSGSSPITSGAVSAGSTFTLVIDNLTIPGDYNGDGMVNAADYTVWRDSNGSTTNLAADGNGDLTVNAADYTIWAGNYGANASFATAIPEPTACLIGVSAVTIIVSGTRRRTL
ncbi:hypothetical protein Pla108_40740 [Botrimarina colliarenosi]|uniref:Dockerin domain-containing protein n=1 Tax=Botrimarina colliarenosi TaxID=2528001 RepID=A0A5C5ZYU8_9BACT|nr:dockerin type I repeat-containing protein [Botrimarina colliarenosi]TWT92449.1 hypothetical protein Pla108_40740 [Botrimarina colliarenosi]